MQVMVTFRHLDTSNHLKQYAEDKLSRLDKYLDSAAEAHVVLSVEKFRHIADISLTADGLRLKGAEETEDMYSAIDLVVDNIEKQARRRLDKLKTTKGRRGDNLKSISFTINVLDSMAMVDDEPSFVQTKRIQAKPMDIDEAILQLDMMKNDFLVFTTD